MSYSAIRKRNSCGILCLKSTEKELSETYLLPLQIAFSRHYSALLLHIKYIVETNCFYRKNRNTYAKFDDKYTVYT